MFKPLTADAARGLFCLGADGRRDVVCLPRARTGDSMLVPGESKTAAASSGASSSLNGGASSPSTASSSLTSSLLKKTWLNWRRIFGSATP